MNLTEALTQIARAASLSPESLIAYASEDTVGGRDTGDWIGMSIFADEGRVLYALTRALQPDSVLEIGTAQGCSAAHILAALAKNRHGRLTSIDIDSNAGYGIAEPLKKRWTFINEDALTAELPAAQMVLDDGEHGYDFNMTILRRIEALHPRVLLSHDALSHLVYGDAFQVEHAWLDTYGQMDAVQIGAAFTGLAYRFNGA